MARAAIALGSNLGDAAGNVRKAVVALEAAGEVDAVSRLYESDPWGVEDQPQFINAVVLVNTELAPRALLAELQRIEQALGRTVTYKWGPRVIDLDIIYYDDMHIEEPGLHIPHPHFRERAFVLVPLAEVDERYAALAAASPDVKKVKALSA